MTFTQRAVYRMSFRVMERGMLDIKLIDVGRSDNGAKI